MPATAVVPGAKANWSRSVAKPTVLVVEDDDLLSELLVFLLESEGYETLPAYDGLSALRLASAVRPALITLDLELPELDGQGVLAGLAADEATSRIPVVVLSAAPRDLSPTCQVKRVLTKPHGVAELAEVVRGSLNGASH